MTSTASSANQIIHGPPLPASPAMRKALEDHVLPISGRRNAGDLVGLGAHFRLFKKKHIHDGWYPTRL